MANILDDEFKISNHLYHNTNTDDYRRSIDMAKEWAQDANRVILTPEESSLDSLEDAWIRFNSMIKKHRRESDWKTIELFGMTNKDIYDHLKSKFIKDDIDDEVDDNIMPKSMQESYIDTSETYYNTEELSYTAEDVEKARRWASESNRIIILPTRTLNELEELWDGYNMMIKKHRRESDWFSLEVFGVTNLKHYEFLKSEFLKEDIRKEDKDNYGSMVECVSLDFKKKYLREVADISNVELAKCIVNMEFDSSGMYDDLIISNIVSDILDKYDSDVIDPGDTIDSINYGDLPYLSPEEMIDMGVFQANPEDNYFGEFADNNSLNDTISVKEWFELYKSANKGLYTEFSNYTSAWLQKIRQISQEIALLEKQNGTEKEILKKKQSMLELGWDPSIAITDKARLLSKESAKFRMKSNFSGSKYRVVDLREYKTSNERLALTEASSSDLKPVYIIMIEGKSYFSKAIKAITKDIYSHIAISLDPELHNMYSYGIATNEHSERRGFRREDIEDLPIGGRIGVFSFFLKENDYNKIVTFIDKFKENAEKTDYSFLNLLTYLFNIPYNMEWKLICSQFVDRCLQSAGISMTGKDPSQTSPSDLYKAMLKEKKIYNLYEGYASKYDSKKTSNLINILMRKAKPLKESFLKYYSNEKKYLLGILENARNLDVLFEMQDHIDIIKNERSKNIISRIIIDPINITPIGEAKEFPVQFDKDGNLFIKNLKKIDYEAEFSKSHKLLKKYLDNDNYEGMKYELSKLWMMISMIEETMHSKKFEKLPSMAIASSKEIKARAKLINDFQFYLGKLLEKEKNFNFTEYYDSSPFSSATTKINFSTINFLGNMIKKFVKRV